MANQPRTPTWAIVATIDEPWPLVIAFTLYHLGIGAREVHLYFDRPCPKAEALLSEVPGVHMTRCTPEYWAASETGTRPDHVNRRQRTNANAALAACKADWIIHMDADEYLRPGGLVEASLAEIPPHVIAVRQLVMERAFVAETPPAHIFEGVFRTKAHEFHLWREEVYGRFGKFMKRGFSGHDAGKTFLRVGTLDVRFGIHFAFDMDDNIVENCLREPDALMHFDGMTELHYTFKMMRRLGLPYYFSANNPDGPARDSQARFLRNNAEKPREVARLFSGLMVLDRAQRAALTQRACLIEQSFDPRPYIAAAVADSGIEVDLSPEAFDAALIDWAANVPELEGAAP